MTSRNLKTQCPHCQARFKVTEQQLVAAKGRVRCGSCMQVFNAVAHRLDRPKPIVEEPSEPKIDAGDDDDNAVFSDNPEEDAAHGAYISPKMTFVEDELSDSFRTMDRSAYSDDPSNSDDINPDTDESWAHALLHEARHHPSSREPIPAPPTETEPPQSALSAEPLSAESDFQDLAMSSDSWSSPSDQRHYGQSNARAQQPPYSDLRQDSIPLQRNHSGKIRVLAWSLIILAVLGVVISQLAWVQFDRFSKIPQLRPFYETGCELVGCTLPPLVDMSAIDSRKLVVKTNPANRNELIVEAVIINGAAFAQPFPAIVLTFADLNGQVVTKRVFSPADYLADGGAQLREMPPQTPVHIAIAIKDPGQSAVSYNIDFRPEPE